MQKWEYLIIHTSSTLGVNRTNDERFKYEKPLIPFLNDVGKQGWEMTAATEDENGGLRLFLKRPATQD